MRLLLSTILGLALLGTAPAQSISGPSVPPGFGTAPDDTDPGASPPVIDDGLVATGATYTLYPSSSLDWMPQVTPYGRSVALDLDGDQLVDHAVLVGNTVRTLFAPGLFEAPVDDVQDDVTSLAVLPGNGTPDDGLVTCGSFGTRVHRWSGDQMVFEKVTLWSTRAAAAHKPVHGQPRKLTLLLADGQTIVEAIEPPAGSGAQWTLSILHVHFEEVLDIALADLGGDHVEDLVLRVKNGIYVRRPNTRDFRIASSGVDSNQIAVLGPRGREQWIALTLDVVNSTNDQMICVISDQGLVDLSVIPGGGGLVGMSSGDSSQLADDQVELALTYSGAYDVSHLQNLALAPGHPDYELETDHIEIVSSGLTPPVAGHQGWPEVVDIDNDGDPDTLLPIQDDGRIFIHLCDQADESLQKPRIVQDDNLKFHLGPTIELHLEIDCDPAAITEGSPDSLELIVYQRPTVNDPVNTEPVYRSLLPLAVATPLREGGRRFDTMIPLLEAPRDGICTTFNSMYWIVMRLVDTEVVGRGERRVLKRFPARLYGIEGQVDNLDNHEFIKDHQPSGFETLSIGHQCLDGGSHALTTAPFIHDDVNEIINSEAGGSGRELPCLPGPMDEKKVPKTQ